MACIWSVKRYIYFFFSLSSLSLGQLLLPAATGQYAVAHLAARFIDETRTDPYDPNHGKRNVMTSLFYPVERNACEETCSVDWMPPTTAKFVGTFASEQYGVPNDTLASIEMPVCCKICASGTKDVGAFPLVVFSPGLSSSRMLYNLMAQALASAGYAVATIDHAFEAIVVEYPDGTYSLGMGSSYWLDEAFPERITGLLDTRIQDGRFVLSQLGVKDVVQNLIPGISGAFDIKRAGFYGHSFGGATAIAALQKDQRFAGAINMDGTQHGVTSDTSQPGLLFGRAEPNSHNSTDDVSWRETLDHLKGWKREIGLKDSGHVQFGDVALLLKLAGFPVDVVGDQLGTLDGARSFEIITTYVQAFMDFVLKGKESELFEGENAAYPEIVLG